MCLFYKQVNMRRQNNVVIPGIDIELLELEEKYSTNCLNPSVM